MQTDNKLVYSSKLDIFGKEFLKQASVLIGAGLFSIILIAWFFKDIKEDALTSVLISFFLLALLFMFYGNQNLTFLRSFEIDVAGQQLKVHLLYIIVPYTISIPFDKLQLKATGQYLGEELTGYNVVVRKEMDEMLTLLVLFSEFDSTQFDQFLTDLKKEAPHLSGIV